MRTQVVGKTSMMSSSSRPSRVHFVLLMSIMMMLMLFNNSTCQACNICGCDGCIMANVQANVTFFHNNHTKQLSCGALQDKANDVDGVGGFDEEFCQTEIVSKAWEKCGCYNKFGQLLTDYYAQTIPPVDPPVDEGEPLATESVPSLTDDNDDPSDNIEDDLTVISTATPLDIEPTPDDSGQSNSNPTMFPSLSATLSPSEPVGTPPAVESSTSPSEAVVVVDSAPTPAPDLVITQVFHGISMVLEGVIVEFNEDAIEAWVEITKIFYENVHRGIIQEEDQQIRRRSLQTNGIRAFATDIRFDGQTVSKKDNSITIKYSQSVHYTQTLDTAPSTLQLIEGPFINPAINRQYIELLKELSGGAGHDLFASIQTETIAVPTIPDQATVESDNDINISDHKSGGHGTTESKTKSKNTPLGSWTMGGIAGLAVAGAFAIGLIFYVCCQRRSSQRDKKLFRSSSSAPYDSSSDDFDHDDEMGGRNPYMDDHCHFEDPMNDEQLEKSMRRSYCDEDDDACRSINRDSSQSSGLSGHSGHSRNTPSGLSGHSNHSRNTPTRTDSQVKKSLQQAYMDDLRENAKLPSVVGNSRRANENTTIYRPEQPAERSKDEIPTSRMNTISMEDLFPEQKSTKNQDEEQATKRRSTDDNITKPPSPPPPQPTTTTTTTTTTIAPTFSRLEDFFPDEDGMNLDDLYLRDEFDDNFSQDDPTVANHGTNYSFNRAFGQHHADGKSVVSAQSGGGGGGGDDSGGMVFVDADMYEDVNSVYQHYQQQQLRQQQRINHQRHQQQRREPEIVVIEAPPGWLGVVIDTPEVMGPPVVYEIMESSPIAGQIRLGDQLISVDDIDVEGMTATEVSSIIGQKASNPVRTFCVIRIPDGTEINRHNLIV